MAINWFKKKQAPTDGDKSAPSEKGSVIETNAPARAEIDIPSESAAGDNELAAESDASSPADHSIPQKSGGLYSRLKKGLAKTREILTTDIDELFSSKSEIDDDMLDELEELLITSDIGVQTAMTLMETIHKRASKVKEPGDLKNILKQEILALLSHATPTSSLRGASKPHVIMVVGVNGVGKTTTIGKLAAKTTTQGQSVLIAAADTFRAAAIEQLSIWAERAGAELVKHKENSDPAAVAFDAIEAAIGRGIDTVFVDTAGRLHTKVNLMEELKKIKRTIGKKIPEAPHEILLVLDATTGQNALAQAKIFHEALDLTGLALTKLDGTAKGGIVVSICQSMQIPLHFYWCR